MSRHRLLGPGIALTIFVIVAALAWPVPVVIAQETRVLTPTAPLALGQLVDVRTLAAGPFKVAPGHAVAEQKKRFLAPDLEELRRMKGRLKVPGALPQATNFVRDTAGPSGPITSTPSASQQFEGLSQADNILVTGAAALPPDPNLGVGPTEIFQMVNQVGRITDKSGSPGSASTFDLATFFSLDILFQGSDPRIIYDADSGRWFGTYLEFEPYIFYESAIILAVSTSSSPTLFCKYRIPGPTNVLQDFPQVGVSHDKVVVSYNGYRFPTFSSYAGAGYYVVDKAGLVGCGASVTAAEAAPDPARTTIFPAQSLSSTNALYMGMHTPSSNVLTLLTVGGVPGVGVVTETPTSLPVNPWVAPPPAIQQGASGVPLDTGDDRVLSAAWQSGSLWLAGNEGCTPAGDTAVRSCLRLIEMRTDSASVRQDMTFGSAGNYYFYPAVRPDVLGNAYVVFTSSSATTYASVRTTGRQASDPLNTLQASSLVRGGEGEQTYSPGRMGDYAGAAVDPSAPQTVWVMGEYIRAPDSSILGTGGVADWGTYVAQLSFPAAPPTFNLAVTESGAGTGTVASTDGKIDCGLDCSDSYAGGSVVTLSAAAAAGSVFSGWSVNGNASLCDSRLLSCTLTVTGDTNVTVTFAVTPLTYTLTAVRVGTGSGSVASGDGKIDCGATCSASYTTNSTVTLTAIPARNSVFSGWSGGGCSGTGPSCTLTIHDNTNISATFNKKGKK
jgi:List-Bact-rpt repeat protein